MKFIYALTLTIICFSATAASKRLFVEMDGHEHFKSDTDTLIRKQSVSLGITGGSDASFFGRTSPKRYRYYTFDAIYNAKSGFFGYGSLWKVSGSFPTIDEVDLGGGYVYHLTKRLSGTSSYTHFFINRDALIIKSLSTNDIDTKNTYDFKLFKASIAADYLFGQASDIFITPSISRYYETKFGIFDNKDYLSFSPSISMILGTQNFVEKYSADQRADPDPALGFGEDTDPTAHANREFNVLNYSFRVPIAYNRPHYTFEMNTRFSIPVNVEGQLKNHREVFFNLTFYYLFF